MQVSLSGLFPLIFISFASMPGMNRGVALSAWWAGPADALVVLWFAEAHLESLTDALVKVTDATFNTAYNPATADYVEDPLAPSDESNSYIVDYTEDQRNKQCTKSNQVITPTPPKQHGENPGEQNK